MQIYKVFSSRNRILTLTCDLKVENVIAIEVFSNYLILENYI